MTRSYSRHPTDKNRLKKYVQQSLQKRQTEPIQYDSIIEFCNNLVVGLDKFTFEGREFIKQVLQDDSNRITVLKSRQVGFTVLEAALMVYHALTTPGIGIMYCSYNLRHMRYISKSLIKPFLQTQTKLDRRQESIESYFLNNGSIITLISGSNAFRQARGYKVDLLCIDEAENLPLEELPVILEAMAASKINKVILGGTGTAEGTTWEKIWKSTNQMEWKDDTWQKTNDNPKNGYHITQRMMPYWTQEDEDRKRSNPEYTPLKFATEVLGIFAPQTELPITYSMASAVFTNDTWHEPRHSYEVVASLDLAGGGEADTIITITELSDPPRVLFSKAIRDKYAIDIMSKIEPVIEQYNPDRIVTDAGGNDHLFKELQDRYEIIPYRFTTSHDPIKYDVENKVNRTFMIQKFIQRLQEQRIIIPNAEPWLLDHLTSQIAETKQQKQGGSYIQFTKAPNRKDDFLMSLVFLECYIYSKTDTNNPNNHEVGIAIA